MTIEWQMTTQLYGGVTYVGKYAQKLQKGTWIGSFKPKFIHRSISGTINLTN